MKPFTNSTIGGEKAIRRGLTAPEGAVNLAWTKSPALSPRNNLIVIDTSRVVEENTNRSHKAKKLAYANSLGILEDEFGNQIFEEEYPIISDVFDIDEDFSTVPGSEYIDDSILPFVHVSRHFHVDFVGLTKGTLLWPFKTDKIRLVDKNGNDFVDESGKRRYKIFLVNANNQSEESEAFQNSSVYRVYVFSDAEPTQELFVTYSKVELALNGSIKNQSLDYKEIYNPRPYFKYVPEETDTVDWSNSRQKIYSTKPASLKEQILGIPHTDVNGYRIHVPRKAIPDPRIFQTFRWRVKAEFTNSVKVDPNTSFESIKCGVLTTNSMPSSLAMYAFLNLQRSAYNPSGVRFVNPLKGGFNPAANIQERGSYWSVNLDTVTVDELRQFDLLILAPTVTDFNLTPYLYKLDQYVQWGGGTLVVDTNNHGFINGIEGEVSKPVQPINGNTITTPTTDYVTASTMTPTTITDMVFDGANQLGGWSFNDGTSDEYNSISPYQNEMFGAGYTQFFVNYHDLYTPLITAALAGSPETQKAVLVRKTFASGGQIYMSTMSFTGAASTLYSNAGGGTIARLRNIDPDISIFESSGAAVWAQNYNLYINSPVVEGSMKLLYNIMLSSVRNRLLDESDETIFSTTFQVTSDWYPSWVINAFNDILSEDEKKEFDFALLPKSPSDLSLAWQRSLSDKTCKQLVYEKITPSQQTKLAGATIKYSIEITNPSVEHTPDNFLNANSIPRAWTNVYSPPFAVPSDFGPHIVRQENVAASYEAGEFQYKTYPSKPYAFQVSSSFITTSQEIDDIYGEIEFVGTATQTLIIPPKSIIINPGSPEQIIDVNLTWSEHGSKVLAPGGRDFSLGYPEPQGMTTWQWDQYHAGPNGGHLNWPFWGATVRLVIGSTGPWVQFVQDAMNRFKYFNKTDYPNYLTVDGYYGSSTSAAVRRFQQMFNARYIDGVIDAETWSLIGYQVIALGSLITDNIDISGYQQFYLWPASRMSLQHIADGNSDTPYAKRSWVSGGPSVIWDAFLIQYSNTYEIHGITVVPYLEGDSNLLEIDYIDVGIKTVSMTNYNFDQGTPGQLPGPPMAADGEPRRIDIYPTMGNTVIVSVTQRGSSGWGTSRMLGVREIIAHAKNRIPGQTAITEVGKGQIVEREISISYRTDYKVRAGFSQLITPRYDGSHNVINSKDYPTISNVKWSGYTLIPDNPAVEVDQDYANGAVRLNSISVINDVSGTNYVRGPEVPGTNVFYTMDPNGVIEYAPANGYITKTDGIRLICNSDGTPYGIPSQLPSIISTYNEQQRHFARLKLSRLISDSTIVIGLYDRNKKEFIFNSAGESEITFIEWVTRGINNVYVAVYSTYEVLGNKALPQVASPAPLPYRWAMPVYGVTYTNNSKIQLELPSPDLGVSDIWPIPVRTGSFSRTVIVRESANGPLTNYLKDYQGTNVKAFYGVPEALNGAWSMIYGRPYIDVKDETPLILDDNVIQVRQSPILMVQQPTAEPSLADPHRPVFKVYTRSTVSSEWTELPWTDIEDYNIADGTILLRRNLGSNNADLIKVSYTTSRQVFNFKYDSNQKINLNPFVNNKPDWIGRPLYVYIVPEYVKDENSKVITGSVSTRTLHLTTENTIFDPIQANYDPLAVLLGIIYITTSFDLNDLTILDTRKRGGGVRTSISPEEITKLITESGSYWDMNLKTAVSYQKGGFMIIRLPSQLRDDFTEQQIREVIDRNVTAGVRYYIEDLNGNRWRE